MLGGFLFLLRPVMLSTVTHYAAWIEPIEPHVREREGLESPPPYTTLRFLADGCSRLAMNSCNDWQFFRLAAGSHVLSLSGYPSHFTSYSVRLPSVLTSSTF